jgi:mRNA-degrading endonuclease toxin of MazEF toxin-antitoxin module
MKVREVAERLARELQRSKRAARTAVEIVEHAERVVQASRVLVSEVRTARHNRLASRLPSTHPPGSGPTPGPP